MRLFYHRRTIYNSQNISLEIKRGAIIGIRKGIIEVNPDNY